MRKGEIGDLVPQIKIEKGKPPRIPFEYKPSILLYAHMMRQKIPPVY